jgi:hypothetical protein
MLQPLSMTWLRGCLSLNEGRPRGRKVSGSGSSPTSLPLFSILKPGRHQPVVMNGRSVAYLPPNQ